MKPFTSPRSARKWVKWNIQKKREIGSPNATSEPFQLFVSLHIWSVWGRSIAQTNRLLKSNNVSFTVFKSVHSVKRYGGNLFSTVRSPHHLTQMKYATVVATSILQLVVDIVSQKFAECLTMDRQLLVMDNRMNGQWLVKFYIKLLNVLNIYLLHAFPFPHTRYIYRANILPDPSLSC